MIANDPQAEPQETPVTPKLQLLDVYVEVGAMRTAYNALTDLDKDGQYRVLTWLRQRLDNDWYRREQDGLADTRPQDDEEPF